MERPLAQTVLDALPLLVLVINKDQIVALSNAAAQEFFAVPAERLNGIGLSEILPDGRLSELVAGVLHEGGSHTVELRYAPCGESPLALQATATALPADADEPPRCLVRLEILSDAVASRIRIEHAEKRAEELRLLVRGMAHELGNLLSIMRTTLDYVRNEPAVRAMATSGRALGVLNDSMDQMDGLLQSLSGFALHQKVAFKSLDLPHLVRITTGLFERSAEERGITIVHDFSEDLPFYQGNPNTLRALLVNLIKNAIEAAPQGGKVCVRVGVLAGDGVGDVPGTIRLEVSDTGGGINEAAMRDLFKPHATSKRGGHGLGLWFCRRAVEEHCGEISVISKRGCGTTFVVTLPLTRE